MTTTITSLLLLVSLLLLLINPLASSLKFLPERKKKQLTKKREKEGWRKTKDGWLRLDLPPDSMLRVGVTYRPNDCPWVSSFLLICSFHTYSCKSLWLTTLLTIHKRIHRVKSRPGDYLSVHYNGTLFSDASKTFDSSILRYGIVSLSYSVWMAYFADYDYFHLLVYEGLLDTLFLVQSFPQHTGKNHLCFRLVESKWLKAGKRVSWTCA